jgi:hypothetical protein
MFFVEGLPRRHSVSMPIPHGVNAVLVYAGHVHPHIVFTLEARATPG